MWDRAHALPSPPTFSCPAAQPWTVIAPSLDEAGRDLLSRMLTYDPLHRISAAEALMHPYFADVGPVGGVAATPSYDGADSRGDGADADTSMGDA